MKTLSRFTAWSVGLLMFVCCLRATWVHNEPPIPPQGGSEINDAIVDGAAEFLHSYAQVILLLKESEIGPRAGFDFLKAGELLDSAAAKLTRSRDYYKKAHSLMLGKSFKSASLQKLRNFDYPGLMAKRKLNPRVFNHVAALLSSGKVAGFYDKMVKDMNDMLTSLAIIKRNIQEGVVPGLEDLRNLYQQYSNFMMSGYYSSLVFSEIKTK